MIIIFIFEESLRKYLEISPVRAMLSSFFAIIIVSMIKIDIVQFFIYDVNQFGTILFVYVFLNIFADSLSLMETRIVLSIAGKKSSAKFFGLLLLDFLLSALLFLVIPISVGDLHIFLDGIFFEGERPWLGILFWSTFFTSILFYLYILSSGILILLYNLLKFHRNFERILPIETKPVRCLGLVSMIVITIIFIIWPPIWHLIVLIKMVFSY